MVGKYVGRLRIISRLKLGPLFLEVTDNCKQLFIVDRVVSLYVSKAGREVGNRA